jgi:RNA polymerase sigma factor FliA
VLEDEEMKGYLRDALGLLSERHQFVVVGLYFENRSFEELGVLLGVTASRVSQLRIDAIAIIRHGIDSQFEQRSTERPKGRVAIRRARFAADLARSSDLRGRLTPPPVTSRSSFDVHPGRRATIMQGLAAPDTTLSSGG